MKESVKGKASGAMESVQEAGSKIGDKAHGNYHDQNTCDFFSFVTTLFFL